LAMGPSLPPSSTMKTVFAAGAALAAANVISSDIGIVVPGAGVRTGLIAAIVAGRWSGDVADFVGLVSGGHI